jgi:hypothetical protein
MTDRDNDPSPVTTPAHAKDLRVGALAAEWNTKLSTLHHLPILSLSTFRPHPAVLVSHLDDLLDHTVCWTLPEFDRDRWSPSFRDKSANFVLGIHAFQTLSNRSWDYVFRVLGILRLKLRR